MRIAFSSLAHGSSGGLFAEVIQFVPYPEHELMLVAHGMAFAPF